jgi:membrane-associated phospholipid phosphatase
MQAHAIILRPQSSYRLIAFAPLVAALAFGFCVAVSVHAQTVPAANAIASASLPDAPSPQSVDPAQQPQSEDVTVRNSPRIFLQDQEAIWTSPVRLRPRDLEWLAPLALATGTAIATDHRAMSQTVSRNTAFNNANINVSNGLIGGFVAAPVALFAIGRLKQDEHAQETGILSAEALADGFVVEQGLKLVFWRERPYVDNGRGGFFQSGAGFDSSFPSAHSTLAWSAASAIAAEYHSPWTQVAVYTGATAVSLTRVLGQQHFPSDVLVGATAGWLIGHYVVKKHHKIRLH